MRAHLVAAGHAALHGLGAPAALALLLPMEAGVPIPVPSDFVMLLVGERAAAGALPIWLAAIAFEAVAIVGTAALFLICRGPGHALVHRLGPRLGLTEERLGRVTALLERRGRPALAVGRGTPGLRTVTVVAAGGSGLSFARAVPALALGASVFLQLHLFLGYVLGGLARQALDKARAPAIAALAALVLGGVVLWVLRRGRQRGGQAWTEACCPACLALGLLSERQPETAASV
jgi:membrane protein DedA with SNARE-associated domain